MLTFKDSKGQGLIEYGLMLFGVAVVVIIGLSFLTVIGSLCLGLVVLPAMGIAAWPWFVQTFPWLNNVGQALLWTGGGCLGAILLTVLVGWGLLSLRRRGSR